MNSANQKSATILEYWPAMFVDERRLDLLSAHFAIDWGGRSAECEFQDAETLECVSATYFYLADNWSRPWPTNDRLTAALRGIFARFDTGERPHPTGREVR